MGSGAHSALAPCACIRSNVTQISNCFRRMKNSKVFRRCLEAYVQRSRQVWNHLRASRRLSLTARAYGRHLHAAVRLHADRKQYVATFFLRNRAELELMRRLADQKAPGSKLDVALLACSKGAEVYSILWTIRSARPDLILSTHALDISQDILDFAEKGVYSLTSVEAFKMQNHEAVAEKSSVTWNTWRDQETSIFEFITNEETADMFEVQGDQARIRPWLQKGITWLRGDACDPELARALGSQDWVVANRFLCHMEPAAANRCLRNIARLVKPGGYIFASGIDLDVRAKVAREMGWKPVMDLIREIHDGDASLRRGWPLEYWGLEPFDGSRPDWAIRYASVFQVGATA
jgi:chemotaxis protein methyltransferase CheR